MKNRRSQSSFTLIEVLVAVMILSIAALTLLRSDANSKKAVAMFQELGLLSESSSVALGGRDIEFHGTSPTLYDLAAKRYNISNDHVIEALRKRQIAYTHKLISSVHPFSDLEEETEEIPQDEGQAIVLDIYEIGVRTGGGQGTRTLSIALQGRL